MTENVKTYYCCPECGCTDIEMSAWVHCNTGVPTNDEGPTEGLYCPQCADEKGDGDIGRSWNTTTTEKPCGNSEDRTKEDLFAVCARALGSWSEKNDPELVDAYKSLETAVRGAKE